MICDHSISDVILSIRPTISGADTLRDYELPASRPRQTPGCCVRGPAGWQASVRASSPDAGPPLGTGPACTAPGTGS